MGAVRVCSDRSGKCVESGVSALVVGCVDDRIVTVRTTEVVWRGR